MRRDRQADDERAAVTFFTFHRDGAAVQLHQLARIAQSKTRSCKATDDVCAPMESVKDVRQVAGRDAHDSPMFGPLFEATRRRFDIREVSADAAYLSHENMTMVGEAGGMPYICFKSNTTAAGGGLMAKMFHLYNLNRDDYLAHYHKRSNVESTVSMVKGKFGDAVRGKSDAAQANEALCKVLCHNIYVVIQSMHEFMSLGSSRSLRLMHS